MRPYYGTLLVLLGIWSVLLPKDASASHIVGGEINYRCLGNQRYEISMTIYRDCRFGNPAVWFDNPAFLGIFGSDNMLVRSLGQNGVLRMSLRGINDTLSPVLNNPCYVIPPSVCVHRTTYRDTLTLPYRVGGYQFAYQRCCRNETIVNIVEPSMTGATFYASISDEALQNCNTSAIFNQWPPIYICRGEKIEFDHGATDSNADSLAYSLCAPITGGTPNNPHPFPPASPPYPEVTWRTGYSQANMLGSTDPLRIDPITGFLQGTPDAVGQFVVGICVEEYKNGRLIATTRRDFQYNVGICGEPTAVFALDSIYCNNEINILNQSQFAENFKWILTGPDIIRHESSARNFFYSFQQTGTYSLTLIAEPGTPCADSMELPLIIEIEDLEAKIDISQQNCGDTIDLLLISQSTSSTTPIAQYIWRIVTPSGDTTFSGDSIQYTTPFSPSLEIWHIVETSRGCRDTLIQTFYPVSLDIPDITDAYRVCPDDTLSIVVPTRDALQWQPHPSLIDADTSRIMRIRPSESTQLFFRITNTLGCIYDGSIQITLFPPLPAFVTEAEPDTIAQGGVSQLTTTLYPGFTYHWDPASTLDNEFASNPLANPRTTTTYTVTITSPDGCTLMQNITVTVMTFPCEETYVFIPNAFSPNGDSINETWNVRSVNLDFYTLMVYDRWGKEVFRTQSQDHSWDGTYSGKPLPKGSYGFYFEGLCLDGTPIIQKGNVTIF